MAWKDIPIEYDARLYSKRIALELLGRQRTDDYIADRIKEHVSDADVADWEFVKTLDTSAERNLTDMTKVLFQSLADIRDRLQDSLEDMRRHFPEFRQIDLDEMLPRE